jgi:ankyrin repeat protein
VAVVEALLRSGASIDERDSELATPLLRAARRGHARLVRLLLDHGASASARDRGSWPCPVPLSP